MIEQKLFNTIFAKKNFGKLFYHFTLSLIQDGYSKDTRIKRAQFIEKNCELIQEFGFAHPEVKTKINRIYNTSFPGSTLWDLTSRNVRLLENSWSVSVRHMWEFPNNSHRFFIEPLGGIHIRSMLYSRYATFLQTAQKSSKLTVLLSFVKVIFQNVGVQKS